MTNKQVLFLVISIVALISIPTAVSAQDNIVTDSEIEEIIDTNDNSPESYEKVRDYINSERSFENDELRQRATTWVSKTVPDQGASNDDEDISVREQPEQADPSNLGDVEITEYKFEDDSLLIEYRADRDIDTMITIVSMQSQEEAIFPIQTTFEATNGSTKSLDLPILPSSNTNIAAIMTQENVFTVLTQQPPGIIGDMRTELLYYAAGGAFLGTIIFALHFLIFTRKIFENYRPNASVLKNQAMTNTNILNRDTLKNEIDDDDVSKLFYRYISIRRIIMYVVLIVTIAYLINFLTGVSLPLPELNDKSVVTLGFAVISYLFLAPMVLQPILMALFNPDIEFAELVSEDGTEAKRMVAKRGVLEDRYEVDGSVPKMTAEEGVPLYLLDEIDQEEQTAKGAFAWTLSEEYQSQVQEKVEFGSGKDKITINMLDILSDPVKAEMVLVDMLKSSKAGQQIRENLPMIQQSIRNEQAKDIAVGLEKAFSGTPVDTILSDMIDSYEAYEEEIKDEVDDLDEDIEDKIDETEGVKDTAQDLADD